jgi:histidinol-phosphate phosphatase family protein
MADPPRYGAFLDRDGTIIEDPGYLSDPAGVRLIPGAAAAIRKLNQQGWVVVTTSNQSGIARGKYGEAEYRAVQQRMEEQLRAAGARIDGAYFCPHHPDFTGPCECRKPGVRMFQDAARELGIDLSRSIYVGDRPADLEPGRRLGGRMYLVRTGLGLKHEAAARTLGATVAPDLAAVAAMVVPDGATGPRTTD